MSRDHNTDVSKISIEKEIVSYPFSVLYSIYDQNVYKIQIFSLSTDCESWLCGSMNLI